MMETYAIASFRSRQQVLRFQQILMQNGIASRIVATPQRVAVGCGLSLRFDQGCLRRAVSLCPRGDSLIGFFLCQDGMVFRTG